MVMVFCISKERVCVPRVSEFIPTFFVEPNSSKYFVHFGATKMYCDMMQYY